MVHCEVTTYFLALMIGASIILGKMFLIDGVAPSVEFLGYSQNLFSLAIFLVLAGYLGVIYYKVANKKSLRLRTIILFWESKP